MPRADAAPEPAWRELRLPIPRDVVASLEVADERPDLVRPHHWRALEERLHRHVMRRLPEGARQVRVELDPETRDMRVRFRLDPGEEARS